MPVIVSLAGRSVGGGRSCVWLSACLNSGFSWAQFSGVRVKASTLKTLFLKRSHDALVKLLLFSILSTALARLNVGPESLSLWIFPCGLWCRMGDASVPAARSAPLSLMCLFHPCAKTLDCSGMET